MTGRDRTIEVRLQRLEFGVLRGRLDLGGGDERNTGEDNTRPAQNRCPERCLDWGQI